MKTVFLIFGVLCLSYIMKAQAHTYHPFTHSTKWTLTSFTSNPPNSGTFTEVQELVRDSVFNNKTYTLLNQYDVSSTQTVYVTTPTGSGFVTYSYNLMGQNQQLLGAIREDSLKRVYYHNFNATFNDVHLDSVFFPSGQDILLFDFGLQVGDSILRHGFIFDYSPAYPYYMHVTAIDSILLENMTYRKQFHLKGYFSSPNASDSISYQWIEGIGALNTTINTTLISAGSGILGGLRLFHQGSLSPPYTNQTIRCVQEQNVFLMGDSILCNSFLSTKIHQKTPINVQLTPNPFHQQTTLWVEGLDCKQLSIRIYNLSGQMVQEQTQFSSNNIIIQRKNLQAGVYFYKLWADEKAINSGKMIIN